MQGAEPAEVIVYGILNGYHKKFVPL